MTITSRLLTFVDIFVESAEIDGVLAELAKLEHLEELYEVTGEFDIVSLISVTGIDELRDILKNKVMKIKGVKSTVSSIVLKADKGPKCNGDNGTPISEPIKAREKNAQDSPSHHHLHAFVDIFVESALMDQVIDALCKLDNVEELHEVTGEFDIVTLVSADDIEEFREVLKNKIMKTPGVRSTVTSVVMQTHKGPRCRD